MSPTQVTSAALQQPLTQVYPTETGATAVKYHSREHSLHFIQDTASIYSHHKTAAAQAPSDTSTITHRTLFTKKGQHCLICQKGFANYHLILIEAVRPINENIPTLVLCEVCASSRGKTWGCSSIKKFTEQTLNKLMLLPSTLLSETRKCAHASQRCKYCFS